MKAKIRAYVESLFADAPVSRRAMELKEEITSNLEDRFDDLVRSGTDEDTAFGTVIAGVGDIDELIAALKEKNPFSQSEVQRHRERSALFISAAVGLYIISIIFPIIFGVMEGRLEILGVVLMFACWAVATTLIVYNAVSKPKYIKTDESMVEDFKEWKSSKSKNKELMKSVQSVVWMLAVAIFFLIGFFLHAFQYAWIVFIVAAAVSQLVKLIFVYRED